MGNFISVGKSSLYFRFLPRVITICCIFLFIFIGITRISSILKQGKFLLMIGAMEFVLLVVSSFILYILAYFEYRNLQYLIEENSLFLKEGVLSVDTETIPFQKIRNASFIQNFLQRLYHVGNIIIDQDPESYTWVSIDEKTARIILDAVSAKSNIQPIVVAQNQQNPYAPPQKTPPTLS